MAVALAEQAALGGFGTVNPMRARVIQDGLAEHATAMLSLNDSQRTNSRLSSRTTKVFREAMKKQHDELLKELKMTILNEDQFKQLKQFFDQATRRAQSLRHKACLDKTAPAGRPSRASNSEDPISPPDGADRPDGDE